MKNLNFIWNQLFIPKYNSSDHIVDNNNNNNICNNHFRLFKKNSSSSVSASASLSVSSISSASTSKSSSKSSSSSKVVTTSISLSSLPIKNRLFYRLLSTSTSVLETTKTKKYQQQLKQPNKKHKRLRRKNFYAKNNDYLINSFNYNNKSISSCPIYNDNEHFTNLNNNNNDNDNDDEQQIKSYLTLQQQRRAISCFNIDNNKLLSINEKEKTPPNKITTKLLKRKINQFIQQQSSSVSTSQKHFYHHNNYRRYNCRCYVCLSTTNNDTNYFDNVLINPPLLTKSKYIGIIREEDEDELSSSSSSSSSIKTSTETTSSSITSKSNEKKLESNDKMFLSQSQDKEPIRPIRHRHHNHHNNNSQNDDENNRNNNNSKLSDRIEPFQKPDDLNLFWQQPKQSISNNKNDNVSPSSSPTKIILRRNSNQKNQLQQNFIRSNNNSNNNNNNNLRSSCPPTSRHRRKSMTTTTITTNEDRNKSPSHNNFKRLLSTNNNNNNNSNSVGIVDNIQTKFNNVVRKSWISSFLHSFNSKEKQSKWKKSDDFEAEFFDRQNDLLTESLLNRRSPLDLNIKNNHYNNGKNKQMSPLSSIDLRNNNESKSQMLSSFSSSKNIHDNNNKNNNNINWIENSIHEPNTNINQKSSSPSSFIRPSSSGLIKKPRPRSACLDNTYMLRMRNGNFIEYNLDSDSKDESCSIISSHHHLSSTNGIDYFSSSSATNYNHHTIYDNDNNDKRQSSTISSKNINSIRSNNNSIITSPIRSLTSSTSPSTTTTTKTSSSSSSSSPFLTKPLLMTTVTQTTTTTSSSLSSTGVLTTSLNQQKHNNHQNYDHHYHHHPHQQHQNNSFSTKTSYSSSPDQNQLKMECPSFVKIYWPVRNCMEIEIHQHNTAYDIIKQVLASQIHQSSINYYQKNLHYRIDDRAIQWSFAIRLTCRNLNSNNDHVWIHPTKNMIEFLDQNQILFEKSYKLELRMRYIPLNLEDLYHKDYPCFKFLYNQLLEEFLDLELSSAKLLTNHDLILELGCYEILRLHPYLTPQALEKNSNWDTLENDFHRIFPLCFTDSIKPKQLKKLIKSKYKKIYHYNQEQMAFNFMNQIISLIDYNREVFHCSLGESIWCVPVDLMIGPKIGIAYFTSNSSPPTVIVKSFDLVEEIIIKSYSTMNKNTGEQSNNSDDNNSGGGSKKILLNLRIKNEDDVLILTCSSFSTAQSIADLIDGYHRLITNNPESIWWNIISETSQRKNQYEESSNSEKLSLRSNSSVIIEPKKAQFAIINHYQKSSFESLNSKHIKDESTANNDYDIHGEEGDYSNPLESCLEIQREHLEISELLGNGHFGNVHKGFYNKNNEENIAVAIKISRVQNDDNSSLSRNDIQMIDQKLLCEAERMHKLDHSNIIKLIGVCSTSPVYIVMELAEYGELRNFLLKNGSQLEHRRLLEYSYQISSAMAFLESKQFVHRDIAARNVLVFSFDCVKLADFGLSRYIEDASYYMATNSKLPIKWMAPESINFRRFTTSSDVWMFGVCIWEIFMLGKKPFPGVKNPDVIGLIECGERLSKPSRCPEQLYELMLKCWRYEPDCRPSFRMIKRKIYDIYQNQLGLIGAIARADIINDLFDSKTSISSSSYSGKDHQSSSSSSSSLSKMHLADAKMAARELNLSSSTSQNSVINPNKIKEILDEQRKQMQEDQKWLQQYEFKWNKMDTYSKSHSDKECGSTTSTPDQNSTTGTPSIYEDAHSDKNMDQINTTSLPQQKLSVHQLYSVPNLQTKLRNNDESYNSFKSTQSSNENEQQSNPSTSSLDSSNNNNYHHHNNIEDLSVSLRKFFKHNQLTNAKVRKEMMEKVNCSSANVDRKEDPVYWSTINVVNSVRDLLRGVQELNTTEYIDLVKNVGQELRNLLANVDIFLETIPKDEHFHLIVVQKKLGTDMNDLVESMKKAIMYSETPMEGAYKQNMLESSYILVIDSKNLMDTVDEIRLRMNK